MCDVDRHPRNDLNYISQSAHKREDVGVFGSEVYIKAPAHHMKST